MELTYTLNNSKQTIMPKTPQVTIISQDKSRWLFSIFRTLLLMLCFFILLPVNAESSDAQPLSDEQMNKEIRIAVAAIERYHPNPFHKTEGRVFYEEVDKIINQKGKRSLGKHRFDLHRVTSMIFDTHTQIHPTLETPGLKQSFPLRFRAFSDGLYIVAASEHYRESIGKRVVSISGHNPAAIIDQLASYAAADSHIRGKVFAELFLYLPETYEVFNLKTSDGIIQLTLGGEEGQLTTVILDEKWDKGSVDFNVNAQNPFLPDELITVHEVFGTTKPFYLENLNKDYWWTFLDKENKYQYLQVNKQFSDNEGYPTPEFHLEWMKAFWDSKLEVLIIDLRNNPGGTMPLMDAMHGFLANAIYAHPTLKGLAVLVGTDTVSAGTVLAARLEYFTFPIFIGAPTGSSPNMYLNTEKLILPYSKIRLEVSRTKYISANEDDTRDYISPDIPMSTSFDQYANGLDPLIEVAKTVNGEMISSAYGDVTFRTTWMRESQKLGRASE